MLNRFLPWLTTSSVISRQLLNSLFTRWTGNKQFVGLLLFDFVVLYGAVFLIYISPGSNSQHWLWAVCIFLANNLKYTIVCSVNSTQLDFFPLIGALLPLLDRCWFLGSILSNSMCVQLLKVNQLQVTCPATPDITRYNKYFLKLLYDYVSETTVENFYYLSFRPAAALEVFS